MPRYSRLEVLAVLLLASVLALYIWSPFLKMTVDRRPSTVPSLTQNAQGPKSGVWGLGSGVPKGDWGKPRLKGPVDVNEASRLELEKLPGIGPTLADRIVRHRDHYGPFQGPVDLMQVKGIGKKRYERLRAWIRVGDHQSEEGGR